MSARGSSPSGKLHALSTAAANAVEQAIRSIRERGWAAGGEILANGSDLMTLQEHLGYDEMIRKVRDEFGINARKVANCIAAYVEFGNHSEAACLPAETLLRLAQRKTPAGLRDEIRAQWRRGMKPTVEDIEAWIIYARATAEKIELTAKFQQKYRHDRAWRERTLRRKRRKHRKEVLLFERTLVAIRKNCPEELRAIAAFFRIADGSATRRMAYCLQQYLPRRPP